MFDKKVNEMREMITDTAVHLKSDLVPSTSSFTFNQSFVIITVLSLQSNTINTESISQRPQRMSEYIITCTWNDLRENDRAWNQFHCNNITV